MRLTDLEILNEYYSPENDKLLQKGKDDLRRPKITLKSLNSMRKRRDIKRFEESERKKFLPNMYRDSSEG